MAKFWESKRVIVTGGAGFVGRHLCEALESRGCVVIAPRSAEYDLRNEDATERLFLDHPNLDVVFHLAATVGGIAANVAHPAVTLYDNAKLGLNVIHQAYLAGVKKVIAAGSVCAYPKFAPTPFIEENLWLGYPEESNGPYGVAKRLLAEQVHAYRKEYGFNGVYLLLANIYGPRDDFNDRTSHVIPALIRKFTDARDIGLPEVLLWGTGNASRDFLYVADAVDAMIVAAEKRDTPEPVNIGTGQETSVAALAHIVATEVGYTGKISWDHTKPDGQPRRVLTCGVARREMGWEFRTSLVDGIRQTVEWYMKERECEYLF